MVRFLGPVPSVKAILDTLDSLYGLVSTFDVMMQGFYRESQGRSDSVAYYTVRLEGKLVSEVETARYIRDHLFYGLRKPLQESICSKLDNPLNDYMALMQVARKAEGKHEQEKHNTSYVSKLHIVSNASSDQAGNANQDTKAPMQDPWS